MVELPSANVNAEKYMNDVVNEAVYEVADRWSYSFLVVEAIGFAVRRLFRSLLWRCRW